MRRAQVTTDNARRMYGDLLDRVIADREEEPEPPEDAEAQDAAPPPAQATRPLSAAPSGARSAHASAQPEPEEARPRVKATFYLHPEDVVTIDRIQMQEFLSTGKKPQRSEIVSRALQLLGAQELTSGI